MLDQPLPLAGSRFQSTAVRRRQILDAAARLAVDEGLDATSMAKVAAEAGLAKGSIYLHFDSRSDLLADLQADIWARMLERPQAIAGETGMTSVEKLDAVVEHLMRFEYEHHDLYHAVFHTVANDGPEPFAQAAGLLRDLLVSGTTAGEFELSGLDLDIVLHFLLHGYVGPCFHHNEPEVAIQNVQLLFRRSVNAQAPWTEGMRPSTLALADGKVDGGCGSEEPSRGFPSAEDHEGIAVRL